jgi:multicomponent Na+:H+ antiporter subunit B
MNTLIFRTMAPLLAVIMLAFAAFILFRGHNAPGGGFIAGLIAAAAMAVYGMAAGISAVERALHVPPLAIAALGLLLAIGSGAVSLAHEAPFLTGLWVAVPLGRDTIEIGTPLLFDIGVFGVVFGAATAVLLRLENGGTR